MGALVVIRNDGPDDCEIIIGGKRSTLLVAGTAFRCTVARAPTIEILPIAPLSEDARVQMGFPETKPKLRYAED